MRREKNFFRISLPENRLITVCFRYNKTSLLRGRKKSKERNSFDDLVKEEEEEEEEEKSIKKH